MFSKYISLSTALLAIASAAPLGKRDACTPGLYNCIDGSHFAQCMVGGTWSVTMSVATGTTCQVGISENPFLPGDGSSGSSPNPTTSAAAAPPTTTSSPASPPSQPTTTTPEISPRPTATQSSDPPPPPAQATTTAQASPAPTSATSSAAAAPTSSSGGSGSTVPIPSGTNTGNGMFPDISSWLSWDAMKARYVNVMGTSCEASGWGANNSPEETQEVLSAIETLHGSVDPRFLLAIAIQESSGCVRVITTNNGVRNPGLLQDSNGAHTCNDAGSVQNPCPVDEINGMIQDGVSGGSDNLQSALATAVQNNFGNSFAYAVAARIYNSGSFDPSNLNNGLGSTSTYVTSVMGRLVGTNL